MSLPALMIYRNNQDKTGGFTLVELMISVAVIGILAGMSAQVFGVLMEAREAAMKRIEISETANAALDYIASDLRAAYLTPDSVKPLATVNDPQPHFRFAGISRDIVIARDLSQDMQKQVPGYKSTNKGALDGLNLIYNDPSSYGTANEKGQPDPDCEDSDSACVDSNIAIFPSDLLHFIKAVDDGGQKVLEEVSYGLNPPGTKLIRRSQSITLAKGTDYNVLNFNDFGQFVDNNTQHQRLVPPAIPIDSANPINVVKKCTDYWDQGAEYGTLSNVNASVTQNYVDRTFEVLAYDVRGLRFRFWYYDYNRGGWRYTTEWDSARETALVPLGKNIFNKPAISSSMEGYVRGGGVHSVIVNEMDDMYPRIGGTGLNFSVSNPSDLLNQSKNPQAEFYETAKRIAARTDGLPNMVEITIYVQDRNHTVNPKRFQTRVSIPNNY